MRQRKKGKQGSTKAKTHLEGDDNDFLDLANKVFYWLNFYAIVTQ